MKSSALVSVFLGLSLPAVFAQTLAPSPTESVGCEPHGDHWHCDSPRTSEPAAVTTIPTSPTTTTAPPAQLTTTTTSVADDHDHEEHTDASGSGTLAPSPTESVGCEPHGDHWHCDGPASATTTSSIVSSTVTSSTTMSTTSVGSVGTTSSSAAPTQSFVTAAAAPLARAADAAGFVGLAVVAVMVL